jgi:hypothetical protein
MLASGQPNAVEEGAADSSASDRATGAEEWGANGDSGREQLMDAHALRQWAVGTLEAGRVTGATGRIRIGESRATSTAAHREDGE